MSIYKIAGTLSDNADVHLIQDGTYLGSKAVNSGSYEVSFESTTPSGLIAVAKKSDGYVVGYGDVVGVNASGIPDLVAASSGAISSIQAISINMGASDNTKSQTITEVDMNRSCIIFTGSTAYEMSSVDYCYATLSWTNSTTITATRSNNGSTACLVKGFVIQFAPDTVNSIQRGTISVPSNTSSATATITAVDLTKSFLTGSYRTGGGYTANFWRAVLYFSNTTTVVSERTSQYKNSICNHYYEVVEFV